MQKHFYLSILLLGLEIISCFIIGFSLLFFISPKAKQLLKQLAAKKSLRDSSDEDKIFFLHWAIPLLSGLLFLFSIKNSSAHTYWVLMPMSFYPLVYLWDRLPQKKGESLMTALVMILSLCSLKIYLSSDPLTAEKVQEQLKNRIVTQQAS